MQKKSLIGIILTNNLLLCPHLYELSIFPPNHNLIHLKTYIYSYKNINDGILPTPKKDKYKTLK